MAMQRIEFPRGNQQQAYILTAVFAAEWGKIHVFAVRHAPQTIE
jgi:hypothetical protein